MVSLTLREPICRDFDRAALYVPEDEQQTSPGLSLRIAACGTAEQRDHYYAERLPPGLAAKKFDWKRPEYFNQPVEERLLSGLKPREGPIIDLVEAPNPIPLPVPVEKVDDPIAEIAETETFLEIPVVTLDTEDLPGSVERDSIVIDTLQF
jgi:hypothetical protein